MGDERQSIIPAGAAAAAALSALHTPRPRLVIPPGAAPTDSPIGVPGGPPPGAPSVWNAKQWGDVMVERVSAEHRAPATPDSSAAWGRTVTIAPGQNPAGCARVMLDRCEPLTVSADVTSAAAWGTNVDGTIVVQPLYTWLQVTYGNGATSAQKTLRVDAHMDTPILASYLDVLCYLGDAQGNPIPSSVVQQIHNNPQAQVAVQVARGVRGLQIHGTLFTAGAGLSSSTANAPSILMPCRLESIAAHLSGAFAGDHYLQVFDATAVPNNNTVPTEEWPLGSTAAPGLPRERLTSPRGFSRGCVFALSTTSGKLTLATDGSSCWCSMETQLL